MRKRLFLIKLSSIFLVLLILFSFQKAFSQDGEPFSTNKSPLPPPTGAVNDYAGVIDAATKQSLEQKIKEFKERNNPQVELAVAVVKTTGERPIFDYSIAVARGWGIGSKDTDNPGALLFVAIDDRKYFTQVSRDLEDELPDGLVGQLQRQYLVPEFRKGNYSKGIADTIDAFIRTIEQRQSGQPVTPTQNEQSEQRKSRGSFSGCNVFVCLIILFILMIIIFSRSGKSKRGRNDNDRWGGGGFGGGGSALPWIIGSIIANSSSSGSSSDSWGGSSDWGGSSGGWGGFGGGGDFGGGGAGGDW